MSVDTRAFVDARRNEPQLNGRQREILDLLVAGKTNGEIGDALGMTLDGAKWNVSEILGKLGLASREQAAEYWRWRNRPAGRIEALRGALGLGTLKWVGGAAAVIVGVAVIGALLRSDDETEAGLPPFYLQARIEVVDRSRSVGTNLEGGPGSEVQRTSELRWWQRDVTHVRWEILNSDGFDTVGTTLVADGTRVWRYIEEQGTYASQPLEPVPDGFRVRPIGISMLIGPGHVGDASEFLASLKGWGGPDATLQKVGTEAILGRPTVIYEFTPAAMSGSSSAGPNGEPIATETGEGSGRIWLDEERVVVMRYVSNTRTADVFAEVTRLDFGTEIDDGVFTFEPPPGAAEDDHNPYGGDSTGTASSGQRGFLVAYSVPPGFFDVGDSAGAFLPYAWSREETGGTTKEFELKLARDAGPAEIVVAQRVAPNGLPPSLQHGSDVDVGGIAAKRVESGGQVRLAFERDGIAITVLGISVTEDELLAVAQSLEPVR